MERSILKIPIAVREEIWGHLNLGQSLTEEAGFMLAKHWLNGQQLIFEYFEWMPLRNGDFQSKMGDYLELSDATRSKIIKRAHDKAACLVEFHSHPGPYPAMFSFADKVGMEEFVPHVRWRLKNRPYVAVVVAESGFDALVWSDQSPYPASLFAIKAGQLQLKPTNLTLQYWRKHYGYAI